MLVAKDQVQLQCCLFLQRALSAYSGHGSEEHAFEPGTVFHVIETLIPDKIDSWLAYPVSRNGKDMHEARLIPGLKRQKHHWCP